MTLLVLRRVLQSPGVSRVGGDPDGPVLGLPSGDPTSLVTLVRRSLRPWALADYIFLQSYRSTVRKNNILSCDQSGSCSCELDSNRPEDLQPAAWELAATRTPPFARAAQVRFALNCR